MPRRHVEIGDEYTALPEAAAPFENIRVEAIDQSSGRIMIVDSEVEFSVVTAITPDELADYWGGSAAAIEPADVDAGFRRFGARYAQAVREKREAFDKRLAEQRSPEQVFAEADASARHVE